MTDLAEILLKLIIQDEIRFTLATGQQILLYFIVQIQSFRHWIRLGQMTLETQVSIYISVIKIKQNETNTGGKALLALRPLTSPLLLRLRK